MEQLLWLIMLGIAWQMTGIYKETIRKTNDDKS